jgi:hypothetical protein
MIFIYSFDEFNQLSVSDENKDYIQFMHERIL